MPDFELEDAFLGEGYARIAGVDEAGRGPLAGPVVCAAVVLDRSAVVGENWAKLDDSKVMTTSAKDALFDLITETATVGVAVIDVEEIDLLNILGATMKGMSDAVRALVPTADFALIDGNRMPPLTCLGETVVKGDGKSLSIAAASVIAKVTRDRIMADLAGQYPGYGWERNAGYGTKQHMKALEALGPTQHHRRSFAPVRKIWESRES